MGEGASFPVTVIHTENGGKHRAVNRAVKEARGEYFTCLDSDDYLTPQAVEHYHAWIQAIKKEPDYRYFAGLSGLKVHEDGRSFGGTGTGAEYVDASSFEQRKYNLGGEKNLVYKTRVLRAFPFAEFEGEKFLTEYVHSMIALAGYKIRWYPVPTMVCEYLPDGLSNQGDTKHINSFDGYTFSSRFFLLLSYNRLRSRIYHTGSYGLTAEKKGLSSSEAAKRLGVSSRFMKFSKIVFRIYFYSIRVYIIRIKNWFSR